MSVAKRKTIFLAHAIFLFAQIQPQTSFAQRALDDPWEIVQESPIGPNAAEDFGSHLHLTDRANVPGWPLVRIIDENIEMPLDLMVRQLSPRQEGAPRLYALVSFSEDKPQVRFYIPKSQRENIEHCKFNDDGKLDGLPGAAAMFDKDGPLCKVHVYSKTERISLSEPYLNRGYGIPMMLDELGDSDDFIQRIVVDLSSGESFTYESFGRRPDRLPAFESAWQHVNFSYNNSIRYSRLLHWGRLVPAPKKWATANAMAASETLAVAFAEVVSTKQAFDGLKKAALTYYRFANHEVSGHAAELVAKILAASREEPEIIVFWLQRALDAGNSRFADLENYNHYAHIHENRDFVSLVERARQDTNGPNAICDLSVAQDRALEEFVAKCSRALSGKKPGHSSPNRLRQSWSQAYLQRGMALAQLGKDTEALQDFLEAKRLESDLPGRPVPQHIRLEIAKVNFRQGDVDASLAALNDAISHSANPVALNMRAEVFQRQGNYAGAHDDLGTVLSLQPEMQPAQRAMLHGRRAEAAAKLGNLQIGIADVTAAIDLAPSAAFYFARARLYEANGDFESALADCQAVLDDNSASPDIEFGANFRQAIIYHRTGDAENAVASFDRLFANSERGGESARQVLKLVRTSLAKQEYYKSDSLDYNAELRAAIERCTIDAVCSLQ